MLHHTERNRLVSEIPETLQRFSTSPWGSRFSYIFKCVVATLLHFKNATLWDVRRLLLDETFRNACVRKLKDPNLLTFWREEFVKLPKGSIDPILNRLAPFLITDNVRNILCQRQSNLDFDHIINHRKIFLANLSTGLLSRELSGVLGTFIVSKLISAAFRRAKIPREQRHPFYLYVNEFQNFMGEQLSVGFEDILAEARKYGLVLAGLANQYVDQLTPPVRAAIFGNVATLITFRLGVKDARLVADEFGAFSAEEIMSLEMGEAICRIGGTQTAFNLTTPPPPAVHDPDFTNIIRARARKYYAMPRDEVAAQFRSLSPARKPEAKAQSSPAKRTTKKADCPTPKKRPDEPWDIWDDFVS